MVAEAVVDVVGKGDTGVLGVLGDVPCGVVGLLFTSGTAVGRAEGILLCLGRILGFGFPSFC